MEKKKQKDFLKAGCTLAAFAAWTLAVCFVDVQAIGPQGSAVGLAAFNGLVKDLTGVHMGLYTLTDGLSLIPFAIVAGFALLGLWQKIARKKVDRSLLVLGGFYLAVAVAFVLFEIVVINYRPILIEGVLEASYPSSTTMLVLCVMQTASMQLKSRIKAPGICRLVVWAITAFEIFMVAGRTISGVHWASDIVGGILLSLSLVGFYKALAHPEEK